MTLKSEFETRIPLKRRVELSNATDDLSSTAAQNDARVNAAVADVIADFVTYAGVTFDDTINEHVANGVRGVLLYLEAYKGDTKAWDKVDQWQNRLDSKLRKTQGNNRIMPKSISKLTPADENPSGATIRPEFDRNSTFDDIIPGKTSGGGKKIFE